MRHLLGILLIVFTTVSCSDYLDENPDDRQELKTVDDVAQLVANAYNEGTYLFVEWMTDNVSAIQDNTQRDHMTEAFKWAPMDSYEAQDSPTYFWNNAYYAIAHANEGLAMLDKVSGDEQKKLVIKGEALITRAYNHFLLVNVFSKQYSLETAGADMGIPYVTTVEDELFKTYSRNSVQETYDLVEKDLLEGLTLLKDDYFVGSKKFHFNRIAALAFASRFYLYKQNYKKCIEYSNLILGSANEGTVFVRDLRQIYLGTSYDEMAAKYSDPQEISNLLAVRKESFYVRSNFGYRSSDANYNEIFLNNIQDELDLRDQRWNYSTDAVFAPKYSEQFRYTTSNTGFPYIIQMELRGEELILNRMESYIMLGEFDKALSDYHTLAAKRYEFGGHLTIEDIKTYYSISDTKNALLRFLLDERRKEFVDEGLRWFDIKRYGMIVNHITLSEVSMQLLPNDIRTAVQIPQSARTNGIEPNPR